MLLKGARPGPAKPGPADAKIKEHAFQKYAPLNANQAALLVGDLLAQGYYLDDGSEAKLPTQRANLLPR